MLGGTRFTPGLLLEAGADQAYPAIAVVKFSNDFCIYSWAVNSREVGKVDGDAPRNHNAALVAAGFPSIIAC